MAVAAAVADVPVAVGFVVAVVRKIVCGPPKLVEHVAVEVVLKRHVSDLVGCFVNVCPKFR